MTTHRYRPTVLFVVCMAAACTAALAAERRVPEMPPPGEKIRVIIDTDAACEIDDLYAIALAVLAQDRFEIEGFVAAHFGDAGGPEGIEKSLAAIQTVLDRAGMAGRFPVKRGSHPLQYSTVPENSEGVDFILQRASAKVDDRPLWIISLGACTDVACAYLTQPEIADRVVVFWHGRTQWPDKAWNFNAYNDLKAVRILFSSNLPLILFDTGTELYCPMDESEREIKPHGRLGGYLHEFRYRNASFQSPKKGFFDLGDIAAIIDPSLAKSEVVPAPTVNLDMLYNHRQPHGRMLRIHHIDRDGAFALLYARLREHNAVKAPSGSE